MFLHTFPDEIFILDSRLAILVKKLSIWLSACIVFYSDVVVLNA